MSSFFGDGFIGDGFSGQETIDAIADPLAFIREGRGVNLLIEIQVRPRLADRATSTSSSNTWFTDGFIGDGFSGDTLLTDVQTAPMIIRASTRPTNFKSNDPVAPNQTSRAIVRRGVRYKTTFDEAIDGASTQIQIGTIELDDSDYYLTKSRREHARRWAARSFLYRSVGRSAI